MNASVLLIIISALWSFGFAKQDVPLMEKDELIISLREKYIIHWIEGQSYDGLILKAKVSKLKQQLKIQFSAKLKAGGKSNISIPNVPSPALEITVKAPSGSIVSYSSVVLAPNIPPIISLMDVSPTGIEREFNFPEDYPGQVDPRLAGVETYSKVFSVAGRYSIKVRYVYNKNSVWESENFEIDFP